MNNKSLDSHKPKRGASAKDKQPAAIEPPRRKPFPKQVQDGEIAFAEMTRSCARDLTDRIKAGVSDVAEMLHRAHEGRAWVALGYPSWAEYCKAEFEMSKTRSYQLLDFVEIKQEIEKSTIVDSPQNESQTRALKSVPADKRAEVWKEAVEAAGGGQVSGTDVEAAGIKVSQSKQAPEISDELRDEIRRTIASALSHAWEKLKVYPEMDWQLFRSGVRGWLQTK
jgi:hypothetical protein